MLRSSMASKGRTRDRRARRGHAARVHDARRPRPPVGPARLRRRARRDRPAGHRSVVAPPRCRDRAGAVVPARPRPRWRGCPQRPAARHRPGRWRQPTDPRSCRPNPSPQVRSAPWSSSAPMTGRPRACVALDVLAGCAYDPGDVRPMSSAARRSARTAASIVEFRVDRRTRADLGTWRRPLDRRRSRRPDPAADRTRRAVRPDLVHGVLLGRRWVARRRVVRRGLVPDARPGRDLATDGHRRPIRTSARRIGLADGRLVSYLACRGLPCPIVATDLATRTAPDPGRPRPDPPSLTSTTGRDSPRPRQRLSGVDRRSGRSRPRRVPPGRPRVRCPPASTCWRASRALAGVAVAARLGRPGPGRPDAARSAPGPTPRSARSWMDAPPPLGRCSHDPVDGSADWFAVAVPRRAGRRTAGRIGRARPRPGAERQPLRPGPGPRVRAGGPASVPAASIADRDQGRRGGRDGHPRQPRRDVRLRRRRVEPHRLRRRRDLWRQRHRLLHPHRPDVFTMWLREQGHVFDWGTLKWCQTYTTPPNGCYDAETIALDEFGHVEILDHHVNHDDDSDFTDAVVQTFSRTKPNAGWNMHVLGRCDVAHAPARVRHAVVGGEVLDLRHARDHADRRRPGVHRLRRRRPSSRPRSRSRTSPPTSGSGATRSPAES